MIDKEEFLLSSQAFDRTTEELGVIWNELA